MSKEVNILSLESWAGIIGCEKDPTDKKQAVKSQYDNAKMPFVLLLEGRSVPAYLC